MKIIRNTGTERVIDLIRPELGRARQLDLVTRSLSLFAFAELVEELSRLPKARVLLPADGADLELLGTEVDRAARNRLQCRWLAQRCASWMDGKVEVRRANGGVPQGAVIVRDGEERPRKGA